MSVLITLDYCSSRTFCSKEGNLNENSHSNKVVAALSESAYPSISIRNQLVFKGNDMAVYAPTAHTNMVWQQVRPNEVSNPDVLNAIQQVERAKFVSSELSALAYADTQLPIGYGQHLLSPLQEGRILQALSLQKTETVLEIGTGSGYFTALLALLARQVWTVEILAELSVEAQQRHQQLGIDNVIYAVGDASQGWPLAERVDAIVVTAAFTTVPEAYLNQLLVGGRMVAIVGTEPAMTVQLIRRVTERQWQTHRVFETVVAPMQNAEPKTEFIF